MKKVWITEMWQACYHDVMKKYENPIEYPYDIKEGQEVMASGWQV